MAKYFIGDWRGNSHINNQPILPHIAGIDRKKDNEEGLLQFEQKVDQM